MAKKKPNGAIPSELFGETSVNSLVNMVINMHGVPGGGKTFAALSASKFWPKTLQRQKKKLVLEDTLVVGWDPAATIGLLQYNMRVRYDINMVNVLNKHEGDVLNATSAMADEVDRLVNADPGLSLLIHDTVTTFNTKMGVYWLSDDHCPISQRTGKQDTQAAYGKILRGNLEYADGMTNLPDGVTSIFLFHQEVIGESKNETQKLKQDQARMSQNSVNVIPSVIGKGLGPYTANASMELVCAKSPVPGKKGQFQYWIYPDEVRSQRTKNRFASILTEKQPAHLGKLLDKVRKACS